MRVKEIEVRAGRTFNHPFEQYSNLQPSVVMKASLDDGEDVDKAVHELQAKAEKIVEEHKSLLLSEIKRLYRMNEVQQRAFDLEKQIRRAQAEFEAVKHDNPDVFAALSDGKMDDESV